MPLTLMIFMAPRSRYLAEDDTTFNNIKGQKQQQTCVCNVLMKYKFVVYTASIILRSIVCTFTGSSSLSPLFGLSEKMLPRLDFLSSRRLFLSIIKRKAFQSSPITSALLVGTCVYVYAMHTMCVCVWRGEGGGVGRGVHLLYYIQKISTYTVTAERTFACFTYSPGFGVNNVPLTLFTGEC